MGLIVAITEGIPQQDMVKVELLMLIFYHSYQTVLEPLLFYLDPLCRS